MKKLYYTSIFWLLLGLYAWAQQAPTKELSFTTTKKDKENKDSTVTAKYLLEADFSTYDLLFAIKKMDGEKAGEYLAKGIEVKPLTTDNFRELVFLQIMKDLNIQAGTEPVVNRMKDGNQAFYEGLTTFFFEAVANYAVVNEIEGPLSGKIRIEKEIKGMYYEKGEKKKNNKEVPVSLSITNMDIEFNDGMIENLLIEVLCNDCPDGKKRLEFFLRYPVSFSTLRSYKSLNSTSLYSEWGGKAYYKISLGDVLSYLPYINNERRDYSPASQTIRIPVVQSQTEAVVRKSPIKDILETRIFTDLFGIIDPANNPNGLVQVEISRKFSLYTGRFGSANDMVSNGFMNFFKPYIAVSKIENTNRTLSLGAYNQTINGMLFRSRFVNSLDLIRYQYFSAGMLLNLYLLDIPAIKTTLCWNAGVDFGLTEVIDSNKTIVNNVATTNPGKPFTVGFFQSFLQASAKYSSDERYGFTVSYSVNTIRILDSEIAQVNFPSGQVEHFPERIYPFFGVFKFLAFIRPGNFKPGFADKSKQKGNEIFFRVTYNHLYADLKQYYFQAQLGYAFNLFASTN